MEEKIRCILVGTCVSRMIETSFIARCTIWVWVVGKSEGDRRNNKHNSSGPQEMKTYISIQNLKTLG